MKRTDYKRMNMVSLGLVMIGLILALGLLLAPLYTIRAGIYTKKSSNTFVGDEKYLEVKKEVEAEADRYREQGLSVQIRESVTERTNSKGEKTSLVTFSIEQAFTRSAISFLKSGLPTGRILMLLLAVMALTVLSALAGSAGSLDILHRDLGRGAKLLRSG